MWARSQASPAAMLQSCMSWHRFGITKDTVGSRAKSAGKLVKGRLFEPGTLLKSVQGACLRAYSPAEHTSDPGPGRSSA